MLEFVERRGSRCLKYDELEQRFGRKDLLPLWVADMDCRVPNSVTQALQQHLTHGVYGYSSSEQLQNTKNAVATWLQTQHATPQIQAQNCRIFAGVLEALAVCIELFCQTDEAVVLHSPAYNGFYTTIQKSKRTLLENNLSSDGNGNYHIDFQLLEEQIQTSRQPPKIFLLCSPHNPTGKVWNSQEINEIIRICQKYDMYLLVDEIHFDIVYPGSRHLSILQEEFSGQYDKIIFLSAPSKTFNIAALRSAYLVSYNAEIMQNIATFCEKFQIGEISLLSHIALQTCYSEPSAKQWLSALLQHLLNNRNYLADFLDSEFPQFTHQKPQATYLYWINCLNSPYASPSDMRTFFSSAGLALGWGDLYHAEGYLRINLACSQNLLAQALDTWKKAHH